MLTERQITDLENQNNKEALRQLSPYQRRLAGEAGKMMDQQSIMQRINTDSATGDMFYDDQTLNFELASCFGQSGKMTSD